MFEMLRISLLSYEYHWWVTNISLAGHFRVTNIKAWSYEYLVIFKHHLELVSKLNVWNVEILNSTCQCGISRGERGWFGMLPGSSYPCISHSFLPIGSGLIALSPASIGHIKHAYVRKPAAYPQNRNQKCNFDHIFPHFSSQSKRSTIKHDCGTNLLFIDMTSLWCYS